MKNQIYQIYYSEATKAQNDLGFLPLDNLANERPDWREYWPIRNFLLKNELAENTSYGFFSPKFKDKTNLEASDVVNFISNVFLRQMPRFAVLLNKVWGLEGCW